MASYPVPPCTISSHLQAADAAAVAPEGEEEDVVVEPTEEEIFQKQLEEAIQLSTQQEPAKPTTNVRRGQLCDAAR